MGGSQASHTLYQQCTYPRDVVAEMRPGLIRPAAIQDTSGPPVALGVGCWLVARTRVVVLGLVVHDRSQVGGFQALEARVQGDLGMEAYLE